MTEEFAPIELTTTEDREEVERVHLFSIDGVKYYARKEVPFNVTLKAQRIYAAQGLDAANCFALVSVFGEEAYEALENFDEITEEQFAYICEYANKVVRSKGKAEGTGPNRATKRRGTKARS